MHTTLKAQAALLQSQEELLEIFVKNVPEGVAMLDRDMRYLQVSDHFCADYSMDSSQLLGRSHYELFPTSLSDGRRCIGMVLRERRCELTKIAGFVKTLYYMGSVGNSSPDGIVGGILISLRILPSANRADLLRSSS